MKKTHITISIPIDFWIEDFLQNIEMLNLFEDLKENEFGPEKQEQVNKLREHLKNIADDILQSSPPDYIITECDIRELREE